MAWHAAHRYGLWEKMIWKGNCFLPFYNYQRSHDLQSTFLSIHRRARHCHPRHIDVRTLQAPTSFIPLIHCHVDLPCERESRASEVNAVDFIITPPSKKWLHWERIEDLLLEAVMTQSLRSARCSGTRTRGTRSEYNLKRSGSITAWFGIQSPDMKRPTQRYEVWLADARRFGTCLVHQAHLLLLCA